MTHNKKINWFDLFMCIGVLLVIALGIVLGVTSCNAQPSHLGDIPTAEYGDCEPDLCYNADHPDTTFGMSIAMYPDGVYDFIYQDGMFLIEYQDDDAFDMDRLAEEDEAYEYYHYIIIECTQEAFFDYLAWYAKLDDSQSDAEYENNHGYYIREVVTDVPGGKNYRYYLQKQ